MATKKMATIITIFLLFVLIAGGTQAQPNEYNKGHTGLHGRSTMEDSNFVFEISGRFWYANLELYLETWHNQSDYSVIINGEIAETGQIEYGKTALNFTLKEGTTNIVVEIDEYIYRFENKIVTRQRGEDRWRPDDPEFRGVSFTFSEWNQFQIKSTISVFLTVVVAYMLMGKKITYDEERSIRRGFY